MIDWKAAREDAEVFIDNLSPESQYGNLAAAHLELLRLAEAAIKKLPPELLGKFTVVDKIGNAFQDAGTMEYPAFREAIEALRKAIEESKAETSAQPELCGVDCEGGICMLDAGHAGPCVPCPSADETSAQTQLDVESK